MHFDFGTGYSSMLQPVRRPFSEMKVDRLFVMAAANPDRLRRPPAVIEPAEAL